MKSKVAIGAAMFAAISTAGCATITRGSSTAFVVESTPAGAEVQLSTGQWCKATPCTFAKIKRDSEFGVTVTKAGYKTYTGAVTHKTAGGGGAGMAGNILFGGVIGAVVDSNNGATQDLVPNPMVVALELDALAAPGPTPAPAPIAQATGVAEPAVALAPTAATPVVTPASAPAKAPAVAQ